MSVAVYSGEMPEAGLVASPVVEHFDVFEPNDTVSPARSAVAQNSRDVYCPQHLIKSTKEEVPR